MKATTVKQVKRIAEGLKLTLEELRQQYEMVAFLNDWETDWNEVLVPNGFPIGKRIPVAYVI